MPERARAAVPTRRARKLRRQTAIVIAGTLAVILAATATLAGIRLIRGDEPSFIGRRPTATAVATSDPTATAVATSGPTANAVPTATPAPSGSPVSTPGSATEDEPVLVAVPLPAPPGARQTAEDELARLLDVSSQSRRVAYVDRFRGAGPLHVRDADGAVSDFEVGPSGTSPVAAAIAPDETWIAVVDGSGALSRIDLADGTTSLISAGSDGLVFGLALEFLPDGRLLTTQVGSLVMPLPSRVVIVDPATAEIEVVSDEEMAYQPTPLTDGSVAYLTTNPDGSTGVRRVARGRETLAVEIGQTTAVDVSPDGRQVVVERAGEELELVSLPDGATRPLGSGSRPLFSPTGDAVAVVDLDAGDGIELDLRGNEISRRQSVHLAWLTCPEGCAP